jgi:hypothetical protein
LAEVSKIGNLTATKLSYRFPIFETSAKALCGTTGIQYWISYRTMLPCMYIQLSVQGHELPRSTQKAMPLAFAVGKNLSKFPRRAVSPTYECGHLLLSHEFRNVEAHPK